MEGFALVLLLVVTLAETSENGFSKIHQISPIGRKINFETSCQKTVDGIFGIVHIGHERDNTPCRRRALNSETVIGYHRYSILCQRIGNFSSS